MTSSTIDKKLENFEFIFEFKIAINFEFIFEIFVNFEFNFEIFVNFEFIFEFFVNFGPLGNLECTYQRLRAGKNVPRVGTDIENSGHFGPLKKYEICFNSLYLPLQPPYF